MTAAITPYGAARVRHFQPPARSQEAAQILAVGRAHMWGFEVLGQAPMLMEPVRLGDWLLVPAQDDPTPLPPRALARIHALFAGGARPQGFVLVHEAPMLLRAPTEDNAATFGAPTSSLVSGGQGATTFLAAIGTALVALATTVLPALFVVAATMVDPILVAVTEDGYWIEIDRWEAE